MDVVHRVHSFTAVRHTFCNSCCLKTAVLNHYGVYSLLQA